MENQANWEANTRTRSVMRGNKRRDTLPELRVRRLIHSAGLRYRIDYPPIPSNKRLRADIVFPRLRIAVFIDGCFWHGCPDHYVASRSNTSYWDAKIKNNKQRDDRTNRILKTAGWTVLRFWAHTPAEEAATQIIAVVTDHSRRCESPLRVRG